MPTPSSSRKTSRNSRRWSVRNSAIHGRGVFALALIRRGERVGEYRGKRITRAQMDRALGARSAPGHTFYFMVDDDVIIDAAQGGNGVRFINHSCAPNCTTVAEGHRLWVEALRTIRPGEELTYDYLLEPGHPSEAFEEYACACGAKRCRGTMVDPAVLKKARRARR